MRAHGLATVQLGEQLVNSPSVYLNVHAVRGLIVPAIAQSWSAPSRGATSVAGSPTASRQWWFPAVPTADAVTSTIALANPSNQSAHVTLRVAVGQFSIAPFTVDLLAKSTREIVVSPSSRVPAAGPARIWISSTAPVTAALLTSLANSTVAWMTPAALAGTVQVVDTTNQQPLSSLSIMNPNNATDRVTISIVGRHGTEAVNVVLAAHRSITLNHRLRLQQYRNVYALIVSTRPVIVGATPTPIGEAIALVQNGSGSR